MAKWKHIINLREIYGNYADKSHLEFDSYPELFEQMKKSITDALKLEKFYSGEDDEIDKMYIDLVNNMADSPFLSAFNDYLQRLYTWGDQNNVFFEII